MNGHGKLTTISRLVTINSIKYKEPYKILVISGISIGSFERLMKRYTSTARPRVHNHVIRPCKPPFTANTEDLDSRSRRHTHSLSDYGRVSKLLLLIYKMKI